MEDNIGNYILVLIVVFVLILWWGSNDYSKRLEEKYDEVYRITQEMRKEIIELAEENDYFIEHFNKYTIDDFYNSTAFEDVLIEFENDIEDIGW